MDMICIKAESEQVSGESGSFIEQIIMEDITFSVTVEGKHVLYVEPRHAEVLLYKSLNEFITQLLEQFDHILIIFWVSMFKFS